MNRCPVVQRVGGMSVPEPMRRNRQIDTRSLGCRTHNSQYRQRLEPSASVLLSRWKDRIIQPSFRWPGTSDQFPHRRWDLNGACDTSLPHYRDLAVVAVGLEIAP